MVSARDVVWDVRGKVSLVTGASSGIGLETAVGLAERGSEVLLLCRNPERGRAAQAEIEARSGHEARLFLADLGSQAQLRRAAQEILDATPSLHILVNNAGAYNKEREMTEDGLEITFAVNHLAYFLLTELLLPLLERSAPARIINVASEAHRYAWIDFDNLQGEQRYWGWFQYCHTKLANILFTRALSIRLEGSDVATYCLHPGVIRSGFAMNTGGLIQRFFQYTPTLLNPARGAAGTLRLASSPEIDQPSGSYFRQERQSRPSRRARDPELAERLWSVSEALTRPKGLHS